MTRAVVMPVLFAFIVVAATLSVSVISCATAGFYDKSDSGVQKVCRQGPLVFCDAGTLHGRGCIVTGMETDARLKQLDAGLYQDTCVVNYLAPGHDINGECILESVCKCEDTAYDAAAPPTWVCAP